MHFQRITRWRMVLIACAFIDVGDSGSRAAGQPPEKEPPLAERRLEIMAERVRRITVTSDIAGAPDHFETTPLFRYDDETRGYIDGTVWRLGTSGRPLAIITTELHPNYLGAGKRVVYDFLSLSDQPLQVRSDEVSWTPTASAFEMKPLRGAPEVSSSAARRLVQIKEQARRFSGTQDVEELARQSVTLRLLPREIDRYTPGAEATSDAAIFLLVNGRNPALVLLIETDGTAWSYGVGRLTLPSDLTLNLDEEPVWTQPRNPPYGWSFPYCASNSIADFP